MEQGSARSLLRASATDADAVRQYLQSIEADELNGLLDSIAPRDAKCGKKKSEFLVQDDWLPLVHLLVQCEATRLRAASRIIQVLRRGSPSELESMQLLTEINLGYSSALDELQELKKKKLQHLVKRKKLLDEIHVVLEIVFSFLEEAVTNAKPSNGKVLPQLLGLVPYFLGMSGELRDEIGTSESLAKLLELPWSCQTVPSLLDVLVEDSALMSKGSWQQLQENVERMVTTSPEMASETMNPVIRECVLVANVTGDHKWIGIARYLLRQLPAHLRQEAEFNLQMSYNQSPRIVSLVCESIRSSQMSEGDVVMQDASSLFDDPECGALDLKADWRDLFLLLHSLQASKPILHHRTSSSRVATEASVFTDIEQLAWWIVQSDFEVYSSTGSSRTASKTIEKHVLDQVELLLNFGGKQIHSREWKALLLMDITFFWIEQSTSARGDDKVATSKSAHALMLLEAIFETAPETRAEVLSSLFERSQKPTQRKVAGQTLSRLFISQSGKLFPHLNAIQDWLSMQFQRSFDSAREFFLIASRLAIAYKDLYNFLMVFLRKLLSTGSRLHQRFAVDMWCTWLDHRLPFNEQQEEEIVSVLKNSVAACHDIQAWLFGRLEQVFKRSGVGIQGPAVLLRKSSWEEFHRFFSREVGKFVVPTTSAITEYADEDDDADEEEDSGLFRFRFSSLDAFYQQNASLDGAAAIGLVFQKLLSCLIQFEKAALQSKRSSDGLPIEGLNENDSDIKQWLVDLVSNWKYFFHWICQDFDNLLNQSAHGRTCEKSAWWKLVARSYIGCGICNISIEMLMWKRQVSGIQDVLAFRGDDCEISVWSLMEVEFSLHRVVQKLASHYANEMGTSLSKEYVKAASYGLQRVLQHEKLQLLTALKNILQDTPASDSLLQGGLSGMSFDAALFTLDSCCRTPGDEDVLGAFYPRDIEEDGLSEAGRILEVLLCVYLSVRDRVVSVSDVPDTDGIDSLSKDKNGGKEESSYSFQFSLYADSISAKFPASARHLVAPGKNAKAVVLLDTKGGEEMLEHVCAAIERILDMMIKASNLHSVHEQLGEVLHSLSRSGQNQWPDGQGNSGNNNFGRLSCYFLSDVKECVQLDGLTKLSVSCASLSKRFRDIAAEIADGNEDCSDSYALSSLAYDVLCDNVVYNPRLLRLLLSICLPTHLALHIRTFVTLERKIEGIMHACGIKSTEDETASSHSSKKNRKRWHDLKKKRQKNDTPARRKRLRQDFDARSSYGLKVDSDSDSDASYASDPVRSDDSSTSITATTNQASLSSERIPHIQSHASQTIAILAVLAVLEQSHAALLSAITTKTGSSAPSSFPHHQEISGYIRIHELVNKAIADDQGFAWGTRKVLLKILHMIELGLRIGKASGVLRKGDKPELGLVNDTIIWIYEASVTSALTSRVWVEGIKDASQDPGTKAKVSATLLKMDIFFLQVPGTVQSWLKDVSTSVIKYSCLTANSRMFALLNSLQSTLMDETRGRLKALATLVKQRIAPTDQESLRRGKAKARQRLLGVVPIVKKRRKRLRSRHPIIDAFLNEEDGADAFADLEDFIE
ncbi:hypothetical protein F441_09457 [Phytophthora nicotianae CJ01A1]|uniref:Uncharacterized protein n=1 Tax=Phytophthora nicotianae CJ01A1 TaxID=1317063 RepID=W2WZC8_PHYNI|nr:hypothetical protein F441_09457 [Phytophthora nicotianae CJ01A1]